jgi:ankyrin repeat protein
MRISQCLEKFPREEAASAGGEQEVVQLLLDHGTDVNAQGSHYGTALQAASTQGH